MFDRILNYFVTYIRYAYFLCTINNINDKLLNRYY